MNIVKYLVRNGCTIDIEEIKGRTPLEIASLKGNLKIVEFLIQEKAKINHKNINGETPLYKGTHQLLKSKLYFYF